MKTSLLKRTSSPWQLVFEGVLVSIAATVLLVILFALLISLFDFTDSLIHTVNQVIKILSVGAGVWVTVYPASPRGLVRGALVGLIYMAAGVLVYALLTHQAVSLHAYLADILMGVAAGGLIGLLRARS